jgi:hypothetical protein
VFAIAITLLVLELHVPAGQEALVKGLEHEWPRYLGYSVSFAFIGVVWIAHSNMTRFIKAADPALMRLNLMLLLLVPVLPFTTAVAAAHLFVWSLPFTHLTVTRAGPAGGTRRRRPVRPQPDPGGTHGLPRDQARRAYTGPRATSHRPGWRDSRGTA